MKALVITARVLALVLLLSVLNFNHGQATPSSTPVCGTLTSDSTWSLANSPYDVCASGVIVNAGVTLTIEPGVTAQFEQGVGNKLIVLGTLNANGTVTQPILLTAVVQSPGSWRGISVDGTVANPAVINMDSVTIEYGGDNGSFGAQVYADHASVTIVRSTFTNGPGFGLYVSHNTSFNVSKTSFVGNAHDAISINTPSVDLLMTDLSASGNGADSVRVSGTTTWPGQRHWTNPGIPYIIDGQMSNTFGDLLTIDPGSVLEFTVGGFLNIGGELKAQGTADAPIVMTGQVQSSGSWRGIYVDGGTQPAVAQLDYVTVEYGGSDVNGANIELQNGLLMAHYSIVRNSAKDGIRLDSNAGGSILNSQIFGNGSYGVYNVTSGRAFLASNNWWGDPGGPRSDIPQCISGLGDKVTAGVMYIPVLTDPNSTVLLPLTDAPSLTLTPRRWYAPADNTAKIYFDISLTDGNGFPLPGRTVHLFSTLGTVFDGGITDAHGKTLAYITSASTGDALVQASLDPLTACEGSLSPNSKVTFTTPAAFVDLMPNSASPYYDSDLWLKPLPVIDGVLTTIYARLTNPLTTTVTTDVEFSFAQSGIGLAFGPIKDYTGVVIQPNSSVLLTANFMPVVAGHYCVQVSYSITSIGSRSNTPEARQLKQFNFNAQPPASSPPDKSAGLQNTRTALKNVNRFVDRAYSPNPFAVPLAVANQGISWDLNNAEKISNALQGDPPRQDYTLIDTPVVHQLEHVLPGDGLSQARADALNAVDDALAQANAFGTAAGIALDRSGGATQAGDLGWASTQTGVMLQYNQQMGQALITAAQAIDNLITVASNEGVTSVPITLDDVIAMQQNLAVGWSSQEIADAHIVGLTDADLETLRQSILNANPQDLVGDVIVNMQAISAQFYSLGNILANPVIFNPGYGVVGGGGGLAQAQVINNHMAQVYDQQTSFILSNPNPATAQITLSVRRIGLPADWTVNVSPAQISLDPGQQITVIVSTIAGSPIPQGSHPTVAVEGYVNGQLLGGVVFEILVPAYRPFDGFRYNYLPLTTK